MLNGDVAIARRIECAEASNHAEYVEAVRRLRADVGAATLVVDSGMAAFAGLGSPLTQAFGIGLNGPVDDAAIDGLFDFYRSRGAPVAVEVCHLAHPSLANGLIERGCRVDEHTHVLGYSLTGHEPRGPIDSVRSIADGDLDEWCSVVTRGFTEGAAEPALEELLRFFRAQENSECFGAWREGRMVGGGSVFFVADIAILGGTSTVPEARGRGVQRDLLNVRLDLAAKRGAVLAVISTAPGTVSQRNALRAGFSVLYARTKYVGDSM